MPSAENEALAKATRVDGSLDPKAYAAEYRRGLAERQAKNVRSAQALVRAMDGWGEIDTAADWAEVLGQADDDLQSGNFLLQQLGAQRHLEPSMAAALLILRDHLIAEHGANTAAEMMMIDGALIAHFHMLRINRWLGDLMAAVDTELFGQCSLGAKLDRDHGRGTTVRGLRVEELVQRLAEQVMPLLERANRMLLRNLKALRDHRRAPSPSVNIGQAAQVNVGGPQVNVAASERRMAATDQCAQPLGGRTATSRAGDVYRAGSPCDSRRNCAASR